MQNRSDVKGFWLLVLHAHLPFVRHPELNDSLEERWLYEAITETYIPLLDIFERLIDEGVDYCVTISITPPLCNMLSDSLLQERYIKYLERLIELALKETSRTRYVPELSRCAEMYLNKFKYIYDLYVNRYNKDLIKGFRKLQVAGNLEIICSSATHAFLPLLQLYPNAVRAQIITGINDYKLRFGRKPSGIWNAECGYYPGLENILSETGINYFFLDTHGILQAGQMPEYGVYAPMETSGGVTCFARDMATSHSVWSSETGYPGNPNYREFYRDIGYDLDEDYIKPYVHESGLRIATGIKYHRITDKKLPPDKKLIYIPETAGYQAMLDAVDFVSKRESDIEFLSVKMNRKPVIVSMYDAELFGHWWYEGVDFVYHTIKKMSENSNISMITAPEYLSMYPDNIKAVPSMSSWGSKGYNEFWLNSSNDWIYPHIHKANLMMIDLANLYKKSTDRNLNDALNQLARELMLAQSSDWAFIMKAGTMTDYAVKRTMDHIGRFMKIYDMIKSGKIDKHYIKNIEEADNIFKEINFEIFADN